jgi:hypothetical protein
LKRVLRVPAKIVDTESEQKSVQLSTVFLFMNTSTGSSEEEGGGVFRVGRRWQITEEGA